MNIFLIKMSAIFLGCFNQTGDVLNKQPTPCSQAWSSENSFFNKVPNQIISNIISQLEPKDVLNLIRAYPNIEQLLAAKENKGNKFSNFLLVLISLEESFRLRRCYKSTWKNIKKNFIKIKFSKGSHPPGVEVLVKALEKAIKEYFLTTERVYRYECTCDDYLQDLRYRRKINKFMRNLPLMLKINISKLEDEHKGLSSALRHEIQCRQIKLDSRPLCFISPLVLV